MNSSHSSNDDLADTGFERVCEYAQLDCSQYPEPEVKESLLVHYLGYYGLYFGGTKILWINPTLTDRQKAITETHEAVHYLQYLTGSLLVLTRCQAEEHARKVTAIIHNTKYDDSWKESYECVVDEEDIQS